MYSEELIEEGIVKESKDGVATIVIPTSSNCEECSAKLYCKPTADKERTVTVEDPFGLKAGDFVVVSVNGNKIFQTSFVLYGLPLIILIFGLFLGMKFFENQTEIFSTLFSLLLLTTYFLVVKFIFKKLNSPFGLKIINHHLRGDKNY